LGQTNWPLLLTFGFLAVQLENNLVDLKQILHSCSPPPTYSITGQADYGNLLLQAKVSIYPWMSRGKQRVQHHWDWPLCL
jgi:hypothetical protein